MIIGVFNYTAYILKEENDLHNNGHAHDHSHLDDLIKSPSNISWEDLINDCGAKVMIENSARANEIFNRKFFKKVIEWKGYFLSAFIQAFNPLDFNPEHILNLNIRMIPSESLKNPDLFLSLDAKRYNKFLNDIRKLKTGDPISFKASFEALGNEWRPHHLHLLDIKKIDDFIDADRKVLLFKGINFDITGHLKNEKTISEIQKESTIANEQNLILDNKKIEIEDRNKENDIKMEIKEKEIEKDNNIIQEEIKIESNKEQTIIKDEKIENETKSTNLENKENIKENENTKIADKINN